VSIEQLQLCNHLFSVTLSPWLREIEMPRKPTEIVPLMLRLRESLRHRLEQAAKHNDVSMNAEIIDRLEKSFSSEDMKGLLEESAQAAAEESVKRVRELLLGLQQQLSEIERNRVAEPKPQPRRASRLRVLKGKRSRRDSHEAT